MTTEEKIEHELRLVARKYEQVVEYMEEKKGAAERALSRGNFEEAVAYTEAANKYQDGARSLSNTLDMLRWFLEDYDD